VIGTDIQEWQFIDTHQLRVIAEHHHRKVVLREAGHDQLRKGQGYLLGRRDPVLAVENHAVADVEHQNRGAGGLVLGLVHFKVFFF